MHVLITMVKKKWGKLLGKETSLMILFPCNNSLPQIKERHLALQAFKWLIIKNL